MASANVELVRSIFAAWERGDWSAAEWAHPDVEYVLPDGPDPGSWTGLAAMAARTRDALSSWKDYRIEAEEYRELDAERVFVLYRRAGEGKTSGLKLEQLQTKGAHVFHIRDGKVTRFVAYRDGNRALADLGLAPEADSSAS